MNSSICASVCVSGPGAISGPIVIPVAMATCLALLKPCTASSWSVLVSNKFGLTQGLSWLSAEVMVTFPRDVVVSSAISTDA